MIVSKCGSAAQILDLPPQQAIFVDRVVVPSPWLTVFEPVNLYDAELRAGRIDLESSQSVEIDLYLPGAFAVAVPVKQRAQEL